MAKHARIEGEPKASAAQTGAQAPLPVRAPAPTPDPRAEAMSARQRKSRRMRRVLIAVAILLVALIGALIYLLVNLYQESSLLASQQTLEQQLTADDLTGDDMSDSTSSTVRTTDPPDVSILMGMTLDDALTALDRGATVSGEREVNETGNPVRTSVTVALTDEPSDARLGTPTVYLGLGESGTVVMAGYSASTSALGYGSLSFRDAVRNEGIVEKTLAEAGISVDPASVQLPDDPATYSTYATDGTTLMEENCSFAGTVEINGVPYEWSAVLVYDYRLANASGNLADTIRQIYLYLEDPNAPVPEVVEEEPAEGEEGEVPAEGEEEQAPVEGEAPVAEEGEQPAA